MHYDRLVEDERLASFVVAPNTLRARIRRCTAKYAPESLERFFNPTLLVDCGCSVALYAWDEQDDQDPLVSFTEMLTGHCSDHLSLYIDRNATVSKCLVKRQAKSMVDRWTNAHSSGPGSSRMWIRLECAGEVALDGQWMSKGSSKERSSCQSSLVPQEPADAEHTVHNVADLLKTPTEGQDLRKSFFLPLELYDPEK